MRLPGRPSTRHRAPNGKLSLIWGQWQCIFMEKSSTSIHMATKTMLRRDANDVGGQCNGKEERQREV
jgi:hypothetical protein